MADFGSFSSSAISSIRARLRSRSTSGLVTAAIWQLSNYAIPLITFPYLARVLGVHGFGMLGLVAAATAYALLITEWGFYLSATQAMARCKTKIETNRVIWSILGAKLLLASISSAIVLVSIFLLDLDDITKKILLLSLLNVLAAVFNLDWALRGSGRLGSFVTASIVGRVLSIPLIYLFVRGPEDIAQAVTAGAVGSFICSFLTLWFSYSNRLISAPSSTMSEAISRIREGAHVFYSMAAVSLYTNCLNLVLGFTSGSTQVGIFSGAEKIRRPVQGLLSPIEMVFYPRLSSLASSDPAQAQILSLKILKIQAGISLVLAMTLYAFAPIFVDILLGSEFDSAVPVVRILSLLLMLIGINNVLGLMIMIPFGFQRSFALCTTAGAAVGLAMAIPLAYSYGAVGAAIAAVGAEFCVVVTMYLILSRRTTWFRLRTVKS